MYLNEEDVEWQLIKVIHTNEFCDFDLKTFKERIPLSEDICRREIEQIIFVGSLGVRNKQITF